MNDGFLEITSKVNSNNSLKYILRIQVNRTESLPQTHIIQSLHPCNVHDIALRFFKLEFFDLTELIVYDIRLQRYMELENQRLWQKLNSFGRKLKNIETQVKSIN